MNEAGNALRTPGRDVARASRPANKDVRTLRVIEPRPAWAERRVSIRVIFAVPDTRTRDDSDVRKSGHRTMNYLSRMTLERAWRGVYRGASKADDAGVCQTFGLPSGSANRLSEAEA